MFANREQVDEFCNAMLDSGLNTKWSGYLSVGVVNDAEGYELLYKSGCRSMIYGVESGSPRILKSVGKNMKLDKIKSNIELCAKSRIVPIVMFMLGFPDETEEDIKATINLAKSLEGGMVVFGFYTPIPGSKMYEQLIENGKILQSNLRATRMTINELMGHLRLKDVLDIKTVQYAILETNGNLSVFPYPASRPASAKEAGIPAKRQHLSVTIVEDGHLFRDDLQKAGKNETWLQTVLQQHNAALRSGVFLAHILQQPLHGIGVQLQHLCQLCCGNRFAAGKQQRFQRIFDPLQFHCVVIPLPLYNKCFLVSVGFILQIRWRPPLR